MKPVVLWNYLGKYTNSFLLFIINFRRLLANDNSVGINTVFSTVHQ